MNEFPLSSSDSGKSDSGKSNSGKSNSQTRGATHEVAHPVFVSRKRRKLWIVIAPALVIIIGGAAWAIWFSSIFAVDQVRAVNADNSELTEQQVVEVRAKAAINTGDPIATVDSDTAAQQVATLPWVKSVEVRRGWPNEIVIAVDMRVPVARVSVGDRQLAVDAQGITFDSLNIQGLPRIDAEGEALVAAVEVLISLPENLRTKVTRLVANSRDDVELILKSGSTVRWGSSEEAEFKAQVLEALLTRRAEIYDVSAPELPTTTNEKGPKKN
jgi:cell division protein FtsQ